MVRKPGIRIQVDGLLEFPTGLLPVPVEYQVDNALSRMRRAQRRIERQGLLQCCARFRKSLGRQHLITVAEDDIAVSQRRVCLSILRIYRERLFEQSDCL